MAPVSPFPSLRRRESLTEIRAANPDLALSGNIISATFNTPHAFVYRKGGDWVRYYSLSYVKAVFFPLLCSHFVSLVSSPSAAPHLLQSSSSPSLSPIAPNHHHNDQQSCELC